MARARPPPALRTPHAPKDRANSPLPPCGEGVLDGLDGHEGGRGSDAALGRSDGEANHSKRRNKAMPRHGPHTFAPTNPAPARAATCEADTAEGALAA